MNIRRLGLIAAAATLSISAQTPLQVGDVREYRSETPHPYPLGRGDRPVVWSDRVVSPGATFVRVHFLGFHLAPGDYVTVSSLDGSQFWTYADRGPHGNGEFWSFAVDGDTAIVEIRGGPRNGHGYKIDSIGHGTVDIGFGRRPQPTQEVVCGTDGREDIVCHANESMIDAAQKAVARLLFVSGGLQYVCTGWLVAGSNASTMLTNNHCMKNQTEWSSLQAKFNYQRTTCGGASNDTTTDYAGGTFLKTNSVNRRGNRGGLDYTIGTLQGNPESTWGEVVATTLVAPVNTLIWFIQHPGGNQKKIGYWEHSNLTSRCKVDTSGATYGQAATGSQIGYGCDSEGGSSGSPIINSSTGRAIGLHHYGGVSSNPCLNSATMMSRVCSDAGSLLSCASN